MARRCDLCDRLEPIVAVGPWRSAADDPHWVASIHHDERCSYVIAQRDSFSNEGRPDFHPCAPPPPRADPWLAWCDGCRTVTHRDMPGARLFALFVRRPLRDTARRVLRLRLTQL